MQAESWQHSGPRAESRQGRGAAGSGGTQGSCPAPYSTQDGPGQAEPGSQVGQCPSAPTLCLKTHTSCLLLPLRVREERMEEVLLHLADSWFWRDPWVPWGEMGHTPLHSEVQGVSTCVASSCVSSVLCP